MNTIEAAALQAIREYYDDHAYESLNERDVPHDVDSCSACRKARTFASLIGVDLDNEE